MASFMYTNIIYSGGLYTVTGYGDREKAGKFNQI